MQRENENKKDRSKLAAPGIEPTTSSEFMLMPCSGANENAGTRVNPGLVNRLTNQDLTLRNAF